MRLVFASFILKSPNTGMGKWTLRVAEELCRLGHTVEPWFAEDFVPLGSLGALGRQAFPISLAWRLVQRSRDFDVAVVHEPSAFYYGRLRRNRRTLIPLVVVSHGVESRAFEDMLVAADHKLASTSLRSRLRHKLIRQWQSDGALALADQVICLSEADRTYLTTRLGLNPSALWMSINGADVLPAVALHGSFHVVFVGSWIPEKGSLALPQIWKRLVKELPQARLRVLGTGRAAKEVLESFPEGIRGTIDIVPTYCGPEELTRHARGASVFLLPSLREGSPLALLEAMSLGLAPVASGVGGVPDILTGELRSQVYSPFDLAGAANLVTQLLLQREDAEHLGRLARIRATQLSWSVTARVVERACLQALGSRLLIPLQPGSAKS